MTIDIRARVYCSLGEIVQGSLSDTYVQGNGLVFCRGSVTLAGIYQPTLGQVVDFAYEKNGYLSRLPRRLRVLSSFADPFTRQTTIQLGCKLTMLEDLVFREAKIKVPIVGPASTGTETKDYSGTINSRPADRRVIAIAMEAKALVETILTRIGITAASQVPLQSRFVREEFDLSQGFIKTLGDLLLSENYLGYLNESEQLAFRSTTVDGGQGPVIRRDEIISLEPVNSGELPGEDIKVDYSTYVIRRKQISSAQIRGEKTPKPPQVEGLPPLREPYTDDPGGALDPPDPPNADPPEDPPDEPNDGDVFVPWMYEDSIGSPVTVKTNWEFKTGNVTNQYVYETVYVPYTETWTEYNSNRAVSRRLTRTRVNAHSANPQYYGQMLKTFGTIVDGGVLPEGQIYIYKHESYEYDDESGDLLRTISQTLEPFFVVSGRLSIPYVYKMSGATGSTFEMYHPIGDDVISEQTITEYDRARYGSLGITKTSRISYRYYGATQEGQQAAQWNGEQVKTVDEASAATDELVLNLVFDSSEVRTVKDPNAYKETLPSRAELIKEQDFNLKKNDPDPMAQVKQKPKPIGETFKPVKIDKKETAAETSGQNYDSEASRGLENQSQWVFESGSAVRRVQTFALPYARDDFHKIADIAVNPYTYIVHQYEANAKQQALAFGRVQNRMLLGHRNGLSLQVPPELMPPRPFDPVYIDLDGLAGQYRVNGLSWAFDANGLACSIDAMFWGGVGTT